MRSDKVGTQYTQIVVALIIADDEKDIWWAFLPRVCINMEVGLRECADHHSHHQTN